MEQPPVGVNPPPSTARHNRPRLRDTNPSWGPIGSLLQRKDPAEYERILRLHNEALTQERARFGR